MKILRCARLGVAFFLCGLVQACHRGETSVLKVTLRTWVGEVVRKERGMLELRRIKTGESSVLSDEEVVEKTWSPTEEDIIATEGFPAYVAWRCSQKVGSGLQGYVTNTFSHAEVVLSLGGDDGVQVGMRFAVYHEGEAIQDPESGELLGHEFRKTGEVAISHVEPGYSLVNRFSPEQDVSFVELGDRFVANDVPTALALLPFRADSQDAQQQADRLSARLLAAFGNRNLFVVDRTRLGEAVAQLGRKPTDPWSPETAAAVAKQVGATASLIGDVSTTPKGFLFRLQLVDVPGAKVLWATARETSR